MLVSGFENLVYDKIKPKILKVSKTLGSVCERIRP